MPNPPERSWTPHPLGREHAADLVEDGEVRGRLGLAFGLGAVVGVVVSALLAGDEDTKRTRMVIPRRFVRPKAPPPDAPIRLSEVAKEEAADLIRGLFREVGGTLIQGVLDYATRPPVESGVSDPTPEGPPRGPKGSAESSDAGST